MFDAFPYDAWGPEVADFWAFGGANSTGTYIVTALGLLLMFASLIGFVRQETGRLNDQQARLLKEGMLTHMRPSAPTASTAPTTPTSE